ncbi:hypothetical protein DFH09DRAFT_1274138 [Mycena vulgaris]|nr:hypothetical protein DFH09DRAFT_1274138 [Mycena vulgaris]
MYLAHSGRNINSSCGKYTGGYHVERQKREVGTQPVCWELGSGSEPEDCGKRPGGEIVATRALDSEEYGLEDDRGVYENQSVPCSKDLRIPEHGDRKFADIDALRLIRAISIRRCRICGAAWAVHRELAVLGIPDARASMAWLMRDCPLLLWGWCWDWDDTDSALQMARDLDNSSASAFIQPRPPSALPPPQGADWSPWAPAAAAAAARTPSPMPPRLPSPPRDGSLTVPLPSTAALTAALPTVTAPSHDPQLQLAWARDVLFLVDRTPSLSTSPLALAAAPLVLSLASAAVPEALHLRATFAASGAYPNLLPANPRAAFRDFEAAARAGYAPAWFRLARDYEAFNDSAHALDCLTRGARANDPAALHRLGAAHLLGQLGLAASPAEAVPYLHRAAVRASLQCPQPAYVFALILLEEFSVRVAPGLLAPFLPGGQSAGQYARALLERAAALHFAPAQYKLGHAFEFAVPPAAFPFDPLLSVQWYSLASQAGEAEADMALSKWFLCGAEGAFDKDESLARTFAAKAAAKGLAAGEFAMGYYCEVGIGGARDIDGDGRGGVGAREWYAKAAAHGNADAAERLRALAQPAAQALGRTEHDALTGDKLVRKRTQARMRSDREGGGAPYTAEPAEYANPHPEAPTPNPYGAPPAGRAPPSAYPAQGAYGQQQQPAGAYGRPPPQQQQDPAQRRTRVMELARKSSLADAGGSHYRSGSAGGGAGFDYRTGSAQGQYGTPPPQGQGYGGAPQAQGGHPAGAGARRMPPLAEQPQHRMSGREGSLPPAPAPGQGPRLHPGAREGSLGVGRGYALSDGGPQQPPAQGGNGSRPGSAAGSMASAGGRAAGVPPGRRPAAGGAGGGNAGGGGAGGGAGGGEITTTTGGGGPATFAEMGFTGAKAEDKDGARNSWHQPMDRDDFSAISQILGFGRHLKAAEAGRTRRILAGARQSSNCTGLMDVPSSPMSAMSFSMGSFGDIIAAADLAMKIVQVLYYSQQVSEDYQGAMTKLVSLHHELILISDSLQLDTAAGLGAVARQSAAAEIACCYTEMRRFLAKTEGVAARGMAGVLNKVWWAASEAKELRSLRAAVSRHRATLSVLIGASNLFALPYIFAEELAFIIGCRIISMTTRDEVRACRDSIQELSTMLKPVPHHILEDMVFIVDPLGDVIRVSMIYGLKYEDLHRIVQAYYPHDRAGSRHISEGSYHLLHSNDGLVLPLSKLGLKLRAGMTLEMSMVLRERANFFDQQRTCPRCKKQAKSELIPQTSWRKCLRCSKFFQVVLDEIGSQKRGGGTLHAVREGPKPEADNDGAEHFRRIEYVCSEDHDMMVARIKVWSGKAWDDTSTYQVYQKRSVDSLSPSKAFPIFATFSKADYCQETMPPLMKLPDIGDMLQNNRFCEYRGARRLVLEKIENASPDANFNVDQNLTRCFRPQLRKRHNDCIFALCSGSV